MTRQSNHPALFLLRLFDQRLAEHHVAARHQEDHAGGAEQRDREDRRRQRQRGGGMATEPGAVPAASGRTLIAPAAEFAITKALPAITIIWMPNSQSGAWFQPVRLN